jgi:hypothetical protein
MEAMTEREMYGEMNALLGAIATAFGLQPDRAARAVEAGEITIEMREDARGERFLAAQFEGRTAQIYQGAIRHAPESG